MSWARSRSRRRCARAQVDAEGRVGSHPGPGAHRRRRPEPGAPGGGRRRHPGRVHRLRHQPALRLGPARRGARPQAIKPATRIVVAGGQESMSQAPHCMHLRNGTKMGDARAGRHHDQGRAVGRLQRLSHGHHRRERRRSMADHPRGAGRVRRRLAAEGGGGAEGRPLQGRDRPGHGQDPARATTVVDTDEYPKHGTTVEALAKLRPAFDKDGTVTAGNASGHQRRRRGASC